MDQQSQYHAMKFSISIISSSLSLGISPMVRFRILQIQGFLCTTKLHFKWLKQQSHLLGPLIPHLLASMLTCRLHLGYCLFEVDPAACPFLDITVICFNWDSFKDGKRGMLGQSPWFVDHFAPCGRCVQSSSMISVYETTLQYEDSRKCDILNRFENAWQTFILLQVESHRLLDLFSGLMLVFCRGVFTLTQDKICAIQGFYGWIFTISYFPRKICTDYFLCVDDNMEFLSCFCCILSHIVVMFLRRR